VVINLINFLGTIDLLHFTPFYGANADEQASVYKMKEGMYVENAKGQFVQDCQDGTLVQVLELRRGQNHDCELKKT